MSSTIYVHRKTNRRKTIPVRRQWSVLDDEQTTQNPKGTYRYLLNE